MSSRAADRLVEVTNRLERAKTERSRLEGEIRALETSLQEELGTTDLEKAAEKVKVLRASADKQEEQVEKGIAAIEEQLR